MTVASSVPPGTVAQYGSNVTAEMIGRRMNTAPELPKGSPPPGWAVYHGPHGGIGWKNLATGKVIYATSGRSPFHNRMRRGAPQGQQQRALHPGVLSRHRTNLRELAEWYAQNWNRMLEVGRYPPPNELSEAQLELHGSGIGLAQDAHGSWLVRAEQKEQTAQRGAFSYAGDDLAHATGGGGGSSPPAPKAPEPKASPPQGAGGSSGGSAGRVTGGAASPTTQPELPHPPVRVGVLGGAGITPAHEDSRQRRMATGPPFALRTMLEPGKNVSLSPEDMRSATAKYQALMAHHGEGTEKRLEELAGHADPSLEGGIRHVAELRHMHERAREHGMTAELPEAPPLTGGPPPAKPGTVRFYHGGHTPTTGGARWVSPDEDYARAFGERSGGGLHFVDIPEDSPHLSKSFNDEGTNVKAPWVSFNAPEEIASQLKPWGPAPEATPAVPGNVPRARPVGAGDQPVPKTAAPDEPRARPVAEPDVPGFPARPLEEMEGRDWRMQGLGDYLKSGGKDVAGYLHGLMERGYQAARSALTRKPAEAPAPTLLPGAEGGVGELEGKMAQQAPPDTEGFKPAETKTPFSQPIAQAIREAMATDAGQSEGRGPKGNWNVDLGDFLMGAANKLSGAAFKKGKGIETLPGFESMGDITKNSGAIQLHDVQTQLEHLGVEKPWESDLAGSRALREEAYHRPDALFERIDKIKERLAAASRFMAGNKTALETIRKKESELDRLQKQTEELHFQRARSQKPGHFGTRKAGRANLQTALDHISVTGDRKGAVREVMKKGGVSERTAKGYVAAAFKEMIRQNELRQKEELDRLVGEAIRGFQPDPDAARLAAEHEARLSGLERKVTGVAKGAETDRRQREREARLQGKTKR